MASSMTDVVEGSVGSDSLADSAYRRLRADIIRGVRGAGERLRIEKLKSIYGMGPTPLREALQRLSSEQLVLAQENRGFVVAPLDLADFADLNFARAEIEKIALRRAISIGSTDWEGQVVAASYVMAKADARLAAYDSIQHDDEWERANTAFHTAMVSACDSRWLLMTRGRLHDMCERYRRASLHSETGHRSTADEHREIAQAVLARDAERACSLTDQHFVATLDILMKKPASRDNIFAAKP